jgi:hypothetical protein
MDANARGTLGTQRGELVEPLQTLPQCPIQKDELCTIYAEAIFLVLISIAILSYIDRQFRAQNFLEFFAAHRGLLSIYGAYVFSEIVLWLRFEHQATHLGLWFHLHRSPSSYLKFANDFSWSSIGGLLSSYGGYAVGISMVARVWELGLGEDVNRSIDREVV